jgi:ABC-2 type transport system ATP-binding protein
MIAAEELTKNYGLKPAIRQISFRIERGEIVGLLGPNGAGKTTILRMLTCFMQPTSGRVTVDGLDCRTRSLEVRRRIGFLPETVPLYPELPVRKFLAFAGSVKGLGGNRLQSEMDRVVRDCGLRGQEQRLIRHLSKGLKQRVGLAQALLKDPPILILDEPTTGLDPAQIVDVRRMIRELGGDRTILLSTHILPEVSQVCQRVIILNQGRILEEDTPQNIANRIQKGLRTSLCVGGPSGDVMERLEKVPGVEKVGPGETEEEFLVESRPDDAVRPSLARAVVESGWDLKEMKSLELSLEEVFVQLVTEETEDSGS